MVSSFAFGGKAAVNDLLSGSWSVEESVTPVDMLDSNGSTGGVSGAFSRVVQSNSTSPTSTPTTSSDYMMGQACTYRHDSLGPIAGLVTGVSHDGSTVNVDMGTPLGVVNKTVTMPAYTLGSYFYSFTLTVPGYGVITPLDIAITPQCNLIVTGAPGGTAGATASFDRFGNFLFGINHSVQGKAVEVDSTGKIYVMHDTTIERFNADGTGATTFYTLAGGNMVKMTIDASDNIWIATTVATANQAIKRLSTAGAVLVQGGTYSAGMVSPPFGTWSNYTGMAADPTSFSSPMVWVGNRAVDANNNVLFQMNSIDTSGLVSSDWNNLGTPGSEFGGLGIDFEPTATGNPTQEFSWVMLSDSGMYDINNSYYNAEVKARPYPASAGSLYGKSDTSPAVAACRNGGGIFALTQGTIYRVTGGSLGGNQAIECYLGAAGFRGTISYGANTPYLQPNWSDYVVFPGWSGNAWTNIKQLCARAKRAITTDGVGLRIIRTDTRQDQVKLDISNRKSAPQISENQPGGQYINVTTQNAYAWSASIFRYVPLYASNLSDQILSVDASGSTATTLQLGVYASTLIKPVAITPYALNTGQITTGPPFYIPIGFSAYGVVDSSTPALQVPPSVWNQSGGNLTMKPNPTQLGAVDFVLTGPTSLAGYTGPFRIGYALSGQVIPFFTVSGYGVSVNPSSFQVATSARADISYDVNSPNLDGPFLNTVSIGWDMARMSAGTLAGGELTCNVDIPVSSITTGFGQIAGSYFYWKRNFWRVTDAKISGGWVSLTAVRDTRSSDVQDGTVTHGTIDTTWSGFRYQDNYLSPGVLNA